LIFKVTPDPYSHTHINGLHLKNWDVEMTMGTSFINEIKGEDPNDFFSGFVFDSVRFNGGLMTNENRIVSGEMDNGGWVSVANGTNHTTTFDPNNGTGNSWGLLSKTTDMNGNPYYTNVCNDEFHIDHNEMITVSYYARATAAGKLLTPFVQDVVTGDIKEYPQVSLTTSFKRYANTLMVDKATSDRYKIKFRGFATAWIYLDKVQVGRKDWITLTDMEKEFLDTPTFIPDYNSGARRRGPQEEVVEVREEVCEKVFPNPVKDILTIEGVDEWTRFNILTISGMIYTSGVGSKVNVSQFPTGLYILVTQNGKRFKFVKE
ncbi:MAG TPA: T9SS type A sorting domain-containing protein, partial [Cyclobacteriaceae bacterium]|nr:T9SS type A sorting domain-containing protein [Cyclobacteriaceae bacterium]